VQQYKKVNNCWALVAQLILAVQEVEEDHGSKPAQANSLQDLISKIQKTKQDW
jgi:hypothetical protein